MARKFTPRFSSFMMLAVRHAARTGLAVVAVVAMVGLLVVGPAQPAAAAGPQISVSPSSGLNPDGDFVVVSGSGFHPNSQLFLMQCRNDYGGDHTCNSIGLQKVMTSSGGSFNGARVKVTGYFGSIDCTQTQCAVKTSAVAGHSGDRSQDVMSPLSFGAPAAPPATAPPAPQAPVTQPPATAPPATEAPATTTTEAPVTTTTTEAPVSTTTTEPAATTTTKPSSAKVTELAGGTDTRTGSGGDDGSSPVPWIVAGFVVVFGAVGGGVYTARARAAR
ncbi:MAG: neocarzinostatin apoprotein domain-containing protein [Aquihabitans sp.]